MPRTITAADARRMLRSRQDLLETGTSEREIRAQVAAGHLHPVRRGWYVGGDEWQELWPEGRHLLHIVAVDRDSRHGIVAAGVSAAVLLGLPLFRVRPARVHVLSGSRAKSAPDVMRHALAPGDDVTVVDGIRCTSLPRTILDVARTLPVEAALSCADAALRSVSVNRHVHDAARADVWRASLLEDASRSSARGIRQARRLIAFSDGRAQLPGESVSRLYLHRLGFRRIDLQVPVNGPSGQTYWVDFGLGDVPVLGEFDGEAKYRDGALRNGRSIEQVVLDEKQREDWIRGATGLSLVRWGSEHIHTPEQLGARLAAFGIRPPAR